MRRRYELPRAVRSARVRRCFSPPPLRKQGVMGRDYELPVAVRAAQNARQRRRAGEGCSLEEACKKAACGLSDARQRLRVRKGCFSVTDARERLHKPWSAVPATAGKLLDTGEVRFSSPKGTSSGRPPRGLPSGRRSAPWARCF